MELKIPMTDTFYMYRESNVEPTEHDRPTGITYRPDPLPSGGYFGGPPEVKSTHLVINGLSDEWQICLTWQNLVRVAEEINTSLWVCSGSVLLGGTIAVSEVKKHGTTLKSDATNYVEMRGYNPSPTVGNRVLQILDTWRRVEPASHIVGYSKQTSVMYAPVLLAGTALAEMVGITSGSLILDDEIANEMSLPHLHGYIENRAQESDDAVEKARAQALWGEKVTSDSENPVEITQLSLSLPDIFNSKRNAPKIQYLNSSNGGTPSPNTEPLSLSTEMGRERLTECILQHSCDVWGALLAVCDTEIYNALPSKELLIPTQQQPLPVKTNGVTDVYFVSAPQKPIHEHSIYLMHIGARGADTGTIYQWFPSSSRRYQPASVTGNPQGIPFTTSECRRFQLYADAVGWTRTFQSALVCDDYQSQLAIRGIKA